MNTKIPTSDPSKNDKIFQMIKYIWMKFGYDQEKLSLNQDKRTKFFENFDLIVTKTKSP
jgi:hypothetical protein